MKREEVIILGGGLSGLSAGMVLAEEGAEFLILETQEVVGGLCRTEEVDGFFFDFTGHLLHLKEGPVRDLVLKRIGGLLDEHERTASIYVEGAFVPYPIQANLSLLPGDLAGKCIDDFRDVASADVPDDLPFDQWSRLQFGTSLAELFMVPYNSKLYVHPLNEMEISWTSWSIPRPTLEDVLRSASGKAGSSFGYNETFFYPRVGGISLLPETLSAGMEDRIRLGERAVLVDTTKKTVTTAQGEQVSYSSLISTVPLPDLLRMTSGLGEGTSQSADRSRHSSVLGICMGFDRPAMRDDHWIYFPETHYPFYRVGFSSNFSNSVAPVGMSSIYAEIAHLPGKLPDADKLAKKVETTLKDIGLLPQDARVVSRIDLPIPFAYVFHDRFRKENLDNILGELQKAGVYSIGRYGAWEYSAMETAIEWGMVTARKVIS